MRLLADENLPRAAVEALLRAGHDVVWVRLSSPGLCDTDVLAQAIRENRILLTFDKDFGDLARATMPGFGVILFRIRLSKPADIAKKLVDLIATRDDWVGHFSVVEPGRIRMRALGG